MNALAVLRFRVLHSEGIHGDALHHLVLQGPVGIIGGRLGDSVHHIHALDDLSERRILAVQVRRIFCA